MFYSASSREALPTRSVPVDSISEPAPMRTDGAGGFVVPRNDGRVMRLSDSRAVPALTTFRIALRATAMALALLVVVLTLSSAVPAFAQGSPTVTWDRYDVTLDVRSDGSIHVTEHQEITFGAQYSSGFAYIPLSNVEEVENVSVSVATDVAQTPDQLNYVRSSRYDAEVGTYSYWIESGELAIDYAFEPTSNQSPSTRVVVLEYDVIGGLRVYEDLDPANQQVWWYAIASEVTEVGPIVDSTVTVNLPEAVPVDQTVAFPENPRTDGRSFTWQRSNMDAGDEFEVSLQFPPITSAETPDWQDRDDQIRQEREEAGERSAWAGVLLLVAGLLTAIGGGVALYALWFTKGRDPNIGLVAEYIPEPPDDLRPGAVGVLVDETFHSRDVVATVLDLARRGVIKMYPTSRKEGSGEYTFTLSEHEESLRDYERMVIDAIFGPGAKPDASVAMPTVNGALATRNSEIAEGFYRDLIDHGYFKESPAKTRNRWKGIFKLTPIVIGAVVIGIVVTTGSWSNFAFFPIAVGVVLMFVSGALAGAMPQKTIAGAESAAKWRAFRVYLDQIDDRQDLAESREIFEKHLPYAVALGLEESWVEKFAYVRTESPQWYGGAGPLFGDGRTVIIGDNRPRRRTHRRGGSWTMMPGSPSNPGSGDRDGGAGWSIPGMQDVSDSAGGGLQGGSDSFFDMLGKVGKAFAESSGSGSGSFGSRGGFGGFSGGGSRGGGGGGGGGGRGFR